MTLNQQISPTRLNELVTIARANPKVDQLYQAVHARSPITVNPSDSKLWSSMTNTNGTHIGVAETAHASEALAHELLHAEFKLDGYRPYLGHYSCLPKIQSEILMQTLMALCNELQHHRFFSKFTSLGLDPKHFYSDADKNSYSIVRREVNKLNSNSNREQFLLNFLTVIAKGGMGKEKERMQLHNFIKFKAGPTTWSVLEAIEATINQWTESLTFDVGPTIVEILRHLGGYNKTWIARSKEFPEDGIFVDSSFTLKDMEEYFRKSPSSQSTLPPY